MIDISKRVRRPKGYASFARDLLPVEQLKVHQPLVLFGILTNRLILRLGHFSQPLRGFS